MHIDRVLDTLSGAVPVLEYTCSWITSTLIAEFLDWHLAKLLKLVIFRHHIDHTYSKNNLNMCVVLQGMFEY